MRLTCLIRPAGALTTTLIGLGCAMSSSSTTTSTTMGVATEATPGGGRVACATTLVGITLPAGFCATVFADSLGGARHMTVAANGDVFVSITNRQNTPGGVIALRDSDRDGRADDRRRFGNGANTGIHLANGYLYLDAAPAILRYPLAAGQLEPSGPPDTIVTGLPTGGHGARTFVIDGNSLLVNVGSRTNACQVADRQLESPGIPNCPELETRAGIWQFDLSRQKQTQADGQRFATGIRNAVAITRHPQTGAIYAVQHGRDNFFQNWPKLYDQKESAEQPSEEFLLVTRGSDYGWPFCYHDRAKDKSYSLPNTAETTTRRDDARTSRLRSHRSLGTGRRTTCCSTPAPSSPRSTAAVRSSRSTVHGTEIRSRRADTTSCSIGWRTADLPRNSRCSRTGSRARQSSHAVRSIARRVSPRERTARSTSPMI